MELRPVKLAIMGSNDRTCHTFDVKEVKYMPFISGVSEVMVSSSVITIVCSPTIETLFGGIKYRFSFL